MMNRTASYTRRGSASVLVIMVLLLLVVFGVLAFASGGSSLRLAEKNARTVRNYYLLDKQAELAVGRLAMLRRDGAAPAEMKAALSAMEGITAVTSEDSELWFTVKDPETEGGASLNIGVAVAPEGLKVLRWKLEYAPFDYEMPVELWEGVN